MKNLIISHRGVHNNIDIPENSIKAFKNSLKRNLPIELDIQLTKDNIIVVCHDENLKRLTGTDIFIKDSTYNQIKGLKLLNTNEYIPTLKDVLNLVDNKVLINIEIKQTNKFKNICNLLDKELENYDNYIIQSFSPRILKYMKKLNNKYKIGLLMSEKRHKPFIYKLFIMYSKPDYLSVSKKYIDKYGNKYNYNKYNIMIWNIKNKNEITKYEYISSNFICDNVDSM